MSYRWFGAAALAVVAASTLMAACARADDLPSWLKDRQARFAAFQAAHPNPDAEIASIKAKTAALIAAYAPSDTPADPDRALDQAPVIWRASATPLELWDGADDPRMIVVPAGEYSMGSPDGEPNRSVHQGPRHRVRIGYGFAVSKYTITVAEFTRFVAESHYDAGDQCFTPQDGKWANRDSRDWRRPDFDQTLQSPAVCMNWNDAKAYVAWLSRTTGHAYRLLSEAEYEYVNRAGTTTSYAWGDDPAPACAYANGFDQDAKTVNLKLTANSCHDGYVFSAPVGSFKPNAFGLYDTTGNVWSWVEDCWTGNYLGAPTDGSAIQTGDCGLRMLRGGSWYSDPKALRAAFRDRDEIGNRYNVTGFRVARTL